jgi:zinc transport system substrate-binding protein
MSVSKAKPIVVLLLAAVLLAACSTGTSGAASAANSSDQINVTVSILPEKYFVERIGGDYVNVNVMVGPGEEPHTYEPKTDQMTALSNSAIYFSIGVDFESAWMERISATNPDMQIVDLSAGIEKIAMTASDGDEEAGSPDPHVWTSPENVKIMSQTIYETLVAADPSHQAEFQANLESFSADINQLVDDINANLAGITTKKFIVFHPAWGYFAHAFGLEQIAIEIGGSEPSAQELAALIDEAKKEDVKVIFGSPEFSTKAADYIAQEVNGQVILLDPLAEDWLENLRSVSATFGEVLNNQNG